MRLMKTNLEIERQERDQRWNAMQTMHLAAKIARQMSHEGINAEKPNTHSTLQTIGIEEGQVGPTQEIIEMVKHDLSDQIKSIRSE